MDIVIAHAGDLSNPSGGTSRVVGIAGGLQRNGHDVTVVVPTPDGTLPDRLSDVDVEPVDVSTGGVANQLVRGGKIVWRAKRVSERLGATLQFEHSTIGGIGSLLGCEGYVLDMHDLTFTSPHYSDAPFGSAVQRAVWEFEKRGVQNADDIVVVSDRMAEMVDEEWGVPPEQQLVVPNGYFADSIEKYRRDTRDENRVVFFGTLHPKIDLEAIRSIAELPEVERLDIIGDGAKREDLEELRSELGEDLVWIHGRLPDAEAYDILSRATVVINPQHRSELQQASSPVKLFDYAGMGLPMVVSAGPDVARELAEHDAAVKIEPGESHADAVRELINYPERRQGMAENASDLAESWTWEDRSAQFVELYQERTT